MNSLFSSRQGVRVGWIAALLVWLAASVASADTLLMPKRPMLMGTSEVVWGVTTLANGTAFTINYGDGTSSAGADCGADTVADRSYIACNHTYALAGTYNATLTVGADPVATVEVNVFDPLALSAFDLRNVNVNRAIHNGLRYLWTSQASRAANFPASATTNWDNTLPYTALVVLAFENQGFVLPNNNNAPTGLFERFVVQRGLNYLFDQIRTLTLTAQPAGSPCVGPGIEAAPCQGLYSTFDPGYSTAVASLPIAASGALARTVAAGLGSGQSPAFYVVGKTYGEVLQRMMNAAAFGQNDGPVTDPGRGGWTYGFTDNGAQASDGSTVGWDLLAQMDAAAAGTTIPAFVKSEFMTYALVKGYNQTSGTFDYNADGLDTTGGSAYANIAKTAVGVQGFFYTGVPSGDAKVQRSLRRMGNGWNVNELSGANGGNVGGLGIETQADYQWGCNNSGAQNKSCSYGMYNSFKALKLYGVTTLPGVGRPAGPGPILADDWYADYVDWLLTNQTSPTNTVGGNWSTMGFSCCAESDSLNAAIAELILSPVALIPPDPTTFSNVGLKHGNPLSTNPDTNDVNTSHQVVARVVSAAGAPIPGVTVSFRVNAGSRNAGAAFVGGVTGTSDANGEVTKQYTDAGPAGSGGTDNIQAFIGDTPGQGFSSNILVKNWVVPSGLKCDADSNGVVNMADLLIINAARGTNATGPNDPRDGNGDTKIDIADVRYCQLRFTPQ